MLGLSMPTIPESFSTTQKLVGRGWDSAKYEEPWVKGVSPTISSISRDGDTLTVIGSNFSQVARTRYWCDIEGTDIGGLPSGLVSWGTNGAAPYSIVPDETAPFAGKSLRMRASQVAIETTTFEFPSYSNQAYVEKLCWHKLHIFDVEGQAEAPQVKMTRVVEGSGQSSMQGRPFSTDWTINSADTGVQLSSRPSANGTAFSKRPEQSVQQDLYNRVCVNFAAGDDLCDGGRVWKIGSIEGFTNSSLVAPSHFASPVTGTPDENSLVGEVIDIRSQLAPESIGLKRVALPYYHRGYQDTEIRIGMMYASDSQERFIISTASDVSLIRNTNSLVQREVESSLAQCKVRVSLPLGFPPGPYFLYRMNHDGLISNGMEVQDA